MAQQRFFGSTERRAQHVERATYTKTKCLMNDEDDNDDEYSNLHNDIQLHRDGNDYT